MSTITIYEIDGTVREQEFDPAGETALADLQALVGGDIQVVQIGGGQIMVINEEGKLQGLAVNHKATALAVTRLGSSDFIVGTAVVMADGDLW